MKILRSGLTGLIMIATVALTAGCEWGSGGGDDSFNTSQGAGATINLSGVYRGRYSNGRAVENTSAGNINTLMISQIGNRLEVSDNQGSRYTGSCGSPGVVSGSDSGVYSAGAELIQGQVSWAGKDGVSGKEITFQGIIHVVAVTDIQGKSSEKTTSKEKTSIKEESFTEDGQKFRRVTTTIEFNDGELTQTVEVFNEKNELVSSTTTTTTTDSSTDKTAENMTYSITEANSQYRLEGTWIEEGGMSSGVDALSPATSGLISPVAPTPDADD